MKRRWSAQTRKAKWIIAGAVIGVLALAGAAGAYFALSTGTSQFSVGTETQVQVNLTESGGPLYPGSATATFTYSFHNSTGTTQTINTLAPAVTTDTNGGVFDTVSNSFDDSCLASWFTVSFTPPTLPIAIPSQSGFVPLGNTFTVTMPANSSVNQSACEGLSPQVTLTAT